VHEQSKYFHIPFDYLQFITTGEKVLSDPNKQRWVHRPKSAQLASMMFYLQIYEPG